MPVVSSLSSSSNSSGQFVTIGPRTRSSHNRITLDAPFTLTPRILKSDLLPQLMWSLLFTRCLFFYLASRFGLCNLVDMSSPLPFPSSADDDMNGTPNRKSSLPRGSSSVTPIRRRPDDLSRPGTVARRALAVPPSSRGSANRGTGLP